MPSKEVVEFLNAAYTKRTGRNIPWESEDKQMIRHYLDLGYTEETVQQTFLAMLQSGDLDSREMRPQVKFFLAFAGKKFSATCQPRCHIQAGYFGIYNFACALSANSTDKTCWLSSRVTAKWCHMDKDTAADGIKWLVDHLWLIPRGTATLNRRLYEVVDHDYWVGLKNTATDGSWEPCVIISDKEEEEGAE